MNEIGNKIKLWRNYRNLTLEQLNALTGIHYARLSKFERGVEIPNHQMLERIETALDINFEELKVTDTEIENLLTRFIDTLFYMKEDYDTYLSIIEKNKEIYMINNNYYKVLLIKFIIEVVNNNVSESSKLVDILDQMIEKQSIYEQLYLEYKAINMYNLDEFQCAIDLMKKAMAISNNYKNTAMIYYHLSLLYHGCGMYEESQTYITKSKYMFVDRGSYVRVVNCDIQQANIYIRVGRYDLASQTLNSCLESYSYISVDNDTKGLTLRNNAWAYISNKDYAKALMMLDIAEGLDPKNGNLILYKIWSNYKLEKYNMARTIISENQYLYNNPSYKERIKLFEFLVCQENQRPTKRVINQAKKVYNDLANKQIYENSFFYLDILIDLLDKAGDKDELIHYLKIKGRLGK